EALGNIAERPDPNKVKGREKGDEEHQTAETGNQVTSGEFVSLPSMEHEASGERAARGDEEERGSNSRGVEDSRAGRDSRREGAFGIQNPGEEHIVEKADNAGEYRENAPSQTAVGRHPPGVGAPPFPEPVTTALSSGTPYSNNPCNSGQHRQYWPANEPARSPYWYSVPEFH
ncbi:hypothetical protein FOZ62_012426, partial [Perkinsus olseni]